jgi:hypothetical protein
MGHFQSVGMNMRRSQRPLLPKAIAVGIIMLITTGATQGQQTPPNLPINALPTEGGLVNYPPPNNLITGTVAVITLSVLGFGLVCLGVQCYLLSRIRASGEDTLRNTTVTLVVTLGVAAIAVGYNSTQITPVLTLFGTIIGFLLGQQTRGEAGSRHPSQSSDPSPPSPQSHG